MIHFIYHHPCADGFGALFAFLKSYTANYNWHCVHEHRAGDPPPLELSEGDIVFAADISFSPAEIKHLIKEVKISKLVILDHHHSAMEELKDFSWSGVEIILDQNKSGAVLAWEYFTPNENVPQLLLYVQDRDLWNWKLPDSKEVSAGLDCVERKYDVWNLYMNDVSGLIKIGKHIVSYKKKLVGQVCRMAKFVKLYGASMAVVVTNTHIHSEVGMQLLEEHPHIDVVAILKYFSADDSHVVSFRSRKKGFDVSALATKYGGGGHQSSASCKEVSLFNKLWSVFLGKET